MQPPPFLDLVIDTHLKDGSAICIRTVRESDEQRLRDGIAHLSAHSRYLRFFSAAPEIPDRVIERLVDADGHDHIAWGAILTDRAEAPAIGVAHAFRCENNEHLAEFSVAVVDEFQGLGVARLLTAVLLLACLSEGLDELEAHTLSENRPTHRLLQSIGAVPATAQHGTMAFQVDVRRAIERLQHEQDPPGLAAIFAQFG